MTTESLPKGRQGFRVWGSSLYYDLRVVGGNHYVDSYVAIHEGVSGVTGGVRIREVAELVYEPSNPNDGNAVSVYVRGLLVGYLARDDAAYFGPLIGAIRDGGFSAICDVQLWFKVTEIDKYIEVPNQWWSPEDLDEPPTAWQAVEGETEPQYSCGAELALRGHNAIYPVNGHPPGHYAMLPPGRMIPVYDLDEDAPPLRQIRKISDEFGGRSLAAFGTLTVGSDGKRERAVVSIDGVPIGRLSLPASKDYVPLIKAELSEFDELAVELHIEDGVCHLNSLRAFETNLSPLPRKELINWHNHLPFIPQADLTQYPERFVHKVWSEEVGGYIHPHEDPQ
ncbi:HIRAN domain-containing protein [Pseudarthrobacter sp. NBSH8]|uniref:HIRAN domain-containing protein n=1 Tax=Pseudarthrobacter sp. NBSH8 TaxID=2596911 RepID=UPI001623E2B2|nr:HIRAN domain-containing protein [Pseudarthrobacter sp. NBSH8]QNE13801.1 hypothetical protein FYJ92_04540 [Pseudarthrobacter sp. NBSH8]